MKEVSFWNRRINLKSKPSVALITEMVICHVMEKYSILSGQAIEKIMREDLWNETILELSEMYSKILLAYLTKKLA